MRCPCWFLFAPYLRETSQRIGEYRLGQVAKPVHRPSLLPIILELLKTPCRVCVKDAETEVDSDQISHRFHIFRIAVQMSASQKDHMAELVREGCHHCEWVFQEPLANGDERKLGFLVTAKMQACRAFGLAAVRRKHINQLTGIGDYCQLDMAPGHGHICADPAEEGFESCLGWSEWVGKILVGWKNHLGIVYPARTKHVAQAIESLVDPKPFFFRDWELGTNAEHSSQSSLDWMGMCSRQESGGHLLAAEIDAILLLKDA